MDKERMKQLLNKCADWLDGMTIKSIDDSYKKVAIFEAIKEIYEELDKGGEANDAGSDD